MILDVNINNIKNSPINNKETINEENLNYLDKNINNKIKILNDPLFAPRIIPNKENIEKGE